VLAACAESVPPTSPDAPSLAFGNGVQAMANGDYAYNQALPGSLGGGAVDIAVTMSTIIHKDGSPSGSFRHSTMIQGQLVEWEGVVTCATFDKVNKRAWIGGVITANNSTHPSFMSAVQAPGKDIWFRVADLGNGGSGTADRSTFVGFEGGGGIITSDQYCTAQIWPNNANPVVSGNLMVK
jgi:hypothetical protein